MALQSGVIPMPPIRTDKAGLALLATGGAVFIFLCTVPAMMTLDVGLHMDALLLSCLGGGVVFGGAFVIGHMVLRRIGLGSRAWYAALGACALALAYASRMRPMDLEAVAEQGLIAYFFILPTLVGAATTARTRWWRRCAAWRKRREAGPRRRSWSARETPSISRVRCACGPPFP